MTKVELPTGWSWTSLATIADLKGGITKGQRRAPSQQLRLVPYLRVANVQRGYLDLDEVKEIEASVEEIDELRLMPGDVLFNEGGDRDKLGREWVWSGELPLCIHQNHVFRARVRFGVIHPRLLSWYANTCGQQCFLEHGKQTTNLASINMTKLGALPIPIPPLREQSRILQEVEKHLSGIDAGVGSLERVLANLKRYRAAVLKAACEGRLVPTEAELARKEGREYEPGDVLLRRILHQRRARWEAEQLAKMKVKGLVPRDDEWKTKYAEPKGPDASRLAELPEGWVWSTVEQLATKVVDGVHKKPMYVAEGIPFVTVRNLTAGPGIDFARLQYVTRADHVEFSKRANPERGDLLISKDGTLGVVRRVDTELEFSIFVSVALVKPSVRELSSYLELALASPQVQAQMVPKGSGLVHIHLEDLRQDCIPLPPLAEQQRIVDEVDRLLSVVTETEKAVRAQLARAQRLRQSVLKHAFEGKLVPQDPHDEPASVLLERIRGGQTTTELKKPRRKSTRRHSSNTEIEP
ncbi:restriction endonuclease subunit S [Sorangium sp. So ce1335]|uniref:restriction endonuclease subunit S n=1 Tax=Sorangium sp. So ce1335 TaxID=3133335 RepID=UPI003F604B99